MIDRFQRFSLAVFEISRCWHKLAAEEMARYGLKGAHAMYLLAMQRSGEGVTAAQLCELCGRDKADTSRAVCVMEEKGLISRAGGKNMYRAQLLLTEEGRKAADHVCRRAAVAVEYAGKGFSEEDRETFYAVLERITSNLQDLTKEGIPQQ